jgi:DNA modification methylase
MGRILCGDSLEMLKTLPDCSVDCCVTSPPYYGLRDYGVDGQIGLEDTPEHFVDRLKDVFSEVRRVLKPAGTCWVNMGDSYAAQRGGTTPPAETLAGGEHGKTNDGANTNRGRKDGYNPTRNASAIGLKHKDMIGIPWMLAFALRADGWYLRQDIIWAKPNPMPESVTDRCTKSHEYIFLHSKSPKYYFDNEAIKEGAKTKPTARDKNKEGYKADYAKGDRFSPGERVYGADGRRNKRDVWRVPVQPVKEAHFATFPEKLIEPCILAGCKQGGVVLDPFFGSGTTGIVAERYGRDYIGIELNPEYVKIAERRLNGVQMRLPIA